MRATEPRGREAPRERVYAMALDTHCAFTEVGVLTPGGRMRERGRCATTIPALAEEIDRVPRPRAVVLEGCPEPRRKGPPADWIARGLREHAADVAVCDPRRNHLIAKDSDKDDPIDVEKLARLYRGGYIKGVHHAESFDRVVFKRHVGLYHDSVQQRVRQANRIIGELRSSGVFVGERSFAESDGRRALGDRLPDHPPVRAELRDYFEIDARYTALAALQELARIGKFDRSKLADAVKSLGINPEKLDPVAEPKPETLQET